MPKYKSRSRSQSSQIRQKKKHHHKHKQHKHKQHHHKNRSKSRSRNRDKKIKKQYQDRSKSPEQQRGKYYKPKINPADIVKQLPNFEPSGILLEFYNAREGVPLKFNEPPESKIPTQRWRIYPFKGNQPLAPILLQKYSCFLIGKDDRICDILLQHPSISRQHAVIQFREIKKITLQGHYEERIKPYLMDLQSSNGTFLNQSRIPASRYIELLSQDKVKFGNSTRQYVIINAQQEFEEQ